MDKLKTLTDTGREGAADRVRVLLADDHEGVLAKVRATLDGKFDIVGVVRNGWDTIAEVRRLGPDVLVTDISMPIMNGLHAVSHLNSNDRTKVVFLTVLRDQTFVRAAFEVGASAYVLKSDLATDLVPAIREAMEGRKYISQSIAP